MIVGWMTLAGAAVPDQAQTKAFLEWHCSADNVWRYAGPLELAAALPDLKPASDGRYHPLEIGPAGIAGPPTHFDTLVVAADAPIAAVAEAFRTLAPGPHPDTLRVALAVPDELAPRPDPPYGDQVLALVEATRADIRSPDGLAQISARWYRASGTCNGAVELMATPDGTCANVAARLAADLARTGCRMDGPTALAMFAITWERSNEGQPVALVPIATWGDDLITGEGTWGEAAKAFLARPNPALAPRSAAPVPMPVVGVEGGILGGIEGGILGGDQTVEDGFKRFHHSELTVKSRVKVPSYPETALGLNIGDQRCLADVKIDVTGKPTEVTVDGCPAVFHETVRTYVLRWRWYRAKSGAEAVVAKVVIPINFTAP